MKQFKVTLGVIYIAAMFVFIPWWQGNISGIRERENHFEIQFEVTPIEFLGSGMIGGFRGIMIDYLWIKVVGLEQKHKYFEAAALVDLIQKLQPNIAATWSFNSWNLAYNISTDYRSPENKWRWIQQGIQVINEGKRRIPNSADLWHKAGWIYYHKVCDPSGEHSIYFQEMVEQMQREKLKRSKNAGEEFKEPLHAIGLAYKNFKRAAELKLHPTVSERVLESLPFYASVRGVRYFLLTKRTPSVQDGLRFIRISLAEFEELTRKYRPADFQGMYNQANDLYSYIDEGMERFPEHLDEFEQAADELDQIRRRARRKRIR